MKYRATPAGTTVVIEHKGKVYQGAYHVERGLITVSYDNRQVVTKTGPMPPATLARMILREIVSGESTTF